MAGRLPQRLSEVILKMKKITTLLFGAALAFGITAFGQNAAPQQQQGQGRGGAPYAWGDKDKDGKCDITGQPVGQGRGRMAARGKRGRGMMGGGPGMRAGRGMGRGMGACCRNAVVPDAKTTPPPAK
jgi:Spy/CpxP family protein refolding chaperone